ncbi:hypothetical protein Tco_0945791 [Tanacetum coccineum]
MICLVVFYIYTILRTKDCLIESSESSVPKETSLRDDVVVRGSDGPHLEHDIDPEIQAEINECIAYADALRAEGINARVVVKAIAQEEFETSARGLVEVRVKKVTHPAVLEDIREPAQEEGAIELEWDNTRLRGTLVVMSQRVSRLQPKELHVRREIRQIRRFQFYDRIRIARLEACARRHLGYHP